MVDRLGIDFAINPVNITAGHILKIIRGGKIVSVSVLLGGHAEVAEVAVDEHTHYREKAGGLRFAERDYHRRRGKKQGGFGSERPNRHLSRKQNHRLLLDFGVEQAGSVFKAG